MGAVSLEPANFSRKTSGAREGVGSACRLLLQIRVQTQVPADRLGRGWNEVLSGPRV